MVGERRGAGAGAEAVEGGVEAGDFAFSRLYGDNIILAAEKPLQEKTPSILTDIQRRNTMGIFGKSFDKKVQEAVAALGRSGLGVRGLTATGAGKVGTLEGEGEAMEAKGRGMCGLK